MSTDNLAIVRSIYTAFAAGDVPAVLGAMSPDIVWNEAENFPYADASPYVGPQAVAGGVFARCVGEWDGFGVHMDDLIDGGDRIVALGRYAGTCKATAASRPMTTTEAAMTGSTKGRFKPPSAAAKPTSMVQTKAAGTSHIVRACPLPVASSAAHRPTATIARM